MKGTIIIFLRLRNEFNNKKSIIVLEKEKKFFKQVILILIFKFGRKPDNFQLKPQQQLS